MSRTAIVTARLTPPEVHSLDIVASRHSLSRSELVREAVATLLAAYNADDPGRHAEVANNGRSSTPNVRCASYAATRRQTA